VVLRFPVHALLDGALLLMTVTGRRGGRRYTFPVGYLDVDGRLLVVTRHAWRADLRGGADVDVLWHGRHQRLRAQLQEDPGSVAETIDQLLAAGHDLRGLQPRLGLRVHGDDRPTREELICAVAEFDLSLITLAASTLRPEDDP